MTRTNLIIIGSGPGGYRAAEHAARHGLTVTIIEAAEAGGTCLNRGCIPTKALCRNAEVANTMRQAQTFGIVYGKNDAEAASEWNIKIDFTKTMQRKQQIVSQLRNGVEVLMQQTNINFVHGFAKFKDSKTVVVGNDIYTADNIIIATGSDAKIPPIEGTGLPGVMTSNELLEIDHIPNRLCIIGAGVIGMEFASVFNSFGSKVTVVEFMKECLPMVDSDIAKRLRQTIAKRGVEFAMQSAVKSIEETTADDGCRQLTVTYEKKSKPQQVNANTVLIATGRKPNIEGLELEKAGVAYTPKGIVVDDNFRTSIDHIYAIGDVNGRCMLAHAATFQGIHAVNHILGKCDSIRFETMPSAIFTYPEAACVGQSEEQLKAEGRDIECRKGFYRANGKAMAMNETDGMVKLFIDKANEGRIIGCHAFGAHASDMVQEMSALINRDTTIDQLADIIHIHPTLSEILHDMASS